QSADEVIAALQAVRWPEGRRTAAWRNGIFVGAAAGLALVALTLRSRGGADTAVKAASGDSVANVLAVLPLSSVGGDTANRWFADGTTEELSTELQKLSGVRVLSPASAAIAVSRVGRDPKALGTLLGAGRLLDGSVRRAGPELRLTVRLVNSD